ncbi:WD40 repeat domain-containing protein [Roseibium denhamense]|uniref:WD-40 repeat-containing protein n=1 Tax=Roseibium denhamense TaxID=76305 RepID=A0ABY1NNL7_9HYPH|nr:WD40 repeat domain-containing protein [Roseibium denhamense]MTI06872.1 WD40 repeat domain-containing protein [Roseibium denhamense]SMP12228.1 WD-40 repeat-containing protein [Roseibium denhamense]
MPTIAPVDLGGFVVRAGFVENSAFFADGEGNIIFQRDEDGAVTVSPHKSGLLAAEISHDYKSLVTSGDDGCIYSVKADGSAALVAERPRKWIDLIACGPSGAVAFASGRTAWVRFADGREREFSHDRAVGGLAFAPKGMRLAVARYDGATLWWAASDGNPVELTWKGAHLGTCFSPDGRYLVTAMQENALHGWRLSDSQDMRMSGYPAKVKSFSWSAKGKYLATSGANAAILWPFSGKTGPMGQQPLQLGTRSDALVTGVACHPTEQVVAISYQDGMIMMCRFNDNAEVQLRRPGRGPIGTMGWDRDGSRLAFGSEAGEAGIIYLQD